MGYVKDWSNMLEGFFKEMFFEVDWMFLPKEDLPEEVLPEESVIDSGSEKKRGAVDDAAIWIRQREVLWENDEVKHLWEENGIWNEWTSIEEKEAWDEKRLEGAKWLSAAIEKGKDFYGRESFAWESMMENASAREAFEKNENGLVFEIEKFVSESYEVENFEKMLDGEDLYTHEMAEAYLKGMTYDNGGDGGYDPMMGEEMTVMERGYGRSADEREKISLKRERREKLLSSFDEGEHGKSHEIKIEMVRHEGERNELDMDETLDRLTERLCNLMAKGADGFYL